MLEIYTLGLRQKQRARMLSASRNEEAVPARVDYKIRANRPESVSHPAGGQFSGTPHPPARPFGPAPQDARDN